MSALDSARWTRRGWAKLAGSAGLYGAASPLAEAESDGRRFPEDFLWGCATSAYQIEGAVAEDGRKPSVWDTYSHTPGKIEDGSNGDVADDHYHLYKRDIQLLRSLGVRCYRFSVAWPRVFPDGTGAPNEKGIAFYQRVTDELLANGIQPFVTLFHWDLPQALEDRFGGWRSQETSKAFADYSALVAKRLGDRVNHFFTVNEFLCYTDQGYGAGIKAPGLRLPPAQVNQVRHNAVYGHGLAVQAIRAAAPKGTKVGLAENSTICVPVIEAKQHIDAARKAMREMNAPFLTAILEGKYLDSYLSAEKANAPRFTAEQMRAIASPLDFVGINVYAPAYVRAAGNASGFEMAQPPRSYPHMASPWLAIGPEAAYWAPRHVADIWGVKEIYITENGCSSDDKPAADGRVYDTDRVMFLRNYMSQMQRAVADGAPLRGYFLWSLMDNFEWSDGYGKRFGIHYVDFKTRTRTPKLSADFYRATIERKTVA